MVESQTLWTWKNPFSPFFSLKQNFTKLRPHAGPRPIYVRPNLTLEPIQKQKWSNKSQKAHDTRAVELDSEINSPAVLRHSVVGSLLLGC